MARIPAADLERLKEEVSVQRLVESAGIELKRAGKDWLGRCPFHDDREASLVVTPGKNLWHCFGCQIGGGPIDWVMKHRGVSFRHAVELLREGLPSLAASAADASPAAPLKRTSVRALAAPVSLDADDQRVLDEAIGYYHQRMQDVPEARAYLAARGLDHPQVIEHFKLGVADRSLGLRLPEKNRAAGGAIRTQLQRIGLLRQSGHEHFNGSLVIPVFNEAGQVVEVYGRKLRDDLRPGTPKHLYLPGPHAGVFNLGGVVEAGQHAPGSREIILCEALIDALGIVKLPRIARCNRRPDLQPLSLESTPVVSRQQVLAHIEQVADGAKHTQKALSVLHRLEPSHQPFPLSGRLVRVFSTVVQTLTPKVGRVRQQLGARLDIGSQPIRHHLTGRARMPSHQLPDKLSGGAQAPGGLHQNGGDGK